MARTIFLILCGLLFYLESSADTLQWDASPYSQEVTPCDLTAAHGRDPNSVAPGVSQDEMDFPRAIDACKAALATDPDNPRLQYQLARVYVYSGQGEKAEPHMEAATAAEYPQALFVDGYMHVVGIHTLPRDVCRAERLLRRAAQYGRLAGQIGYARYALDGEFNECEPAVAPNEIREFLATAATSTSDYYQSMLIEMLQAEADGMWPETEGS